MLSFRTLLLLCAAVIANAPSFAQTIYRCGSALQDRPCANAAQGKAMSSAGGSPTTDFATTVGAMSSACAAVRDRAKRIMWAREVGKTQEEQLATSRSPSDRQLVAEVYAMRGSSTAVSDTLAARCVEEEKAAKATVGAITLLKAAQPEPTGAGSGPAAVAQAPSSGAAGSAADAAEKRKRECDRFAVALRNVQEEELQGGSARRLDELRKRHRDIEATRPGGC